MQGYFNQLLPKIGPKKSLLSVGFNVDFLSKTDLEDLTDVVSLGNVASWKSGVSLIAEKKPSVVYVNLNKFPNGLIFPVYFHALSTKFIGVCKDLKQVSEAYRNDFIYAFKSDSWDEFYGYSLEAIEKYHGRLNKKASFEDKFFGPFSFHTRLIAPTRSGFNILKIREIDYLESELHSTLIYHGKTRTRVFLAMNKFEERLFKFNFRRVHKSFLVNMNKVTEYKRRGKEILIVGSHEIPVSFRKKASVGKFLKPKELVIQKYNLPPV